MATYETAQNLFVTIGDTTFAYRQLGPAHGIPLVLLHGFRGTMDHWDPALLNPLAAARPVLLIDNAGVGRSSGNIPKTFTSWAQHYINVIRALGLREVDVMGYSMGGGVAQLVALNAPNGLVRSLILCGTTPSTGKGTVSAPLGPFNQLKAAVTEEEHRTAFIDCFFNTSERSKAAGVASFERIKNSRKDRLDHVPAEGSHQQAVAFAKFMNPKMADQASYDRFHELKLPVLIANGSDDLLLPTENSILMWKRLNRANAHLHLFPDSGHGFLYQYAGPFAKIINDFLDQSSASSPKL